MDLQGHSSPLRSAVVSTRMNELPQENPKCRSWPPSFPPEMLLECDKHYKFTTQRQSVQFVTDLIFHKDQTNGPRLTAPRFSLPTNTEIASPPADPIVKIDVPSPFLLKPCRHWRSMDHILSLSEGKQHLHIYARIRHCQHYHCPKVCRAVPLSPPGPDAFPCSHFTTCCPANGKRSEKVSWNSLRGRRIPRNQAI